MRRLDVTFARGDERLADRQADLIALPEQRQRTQTISMAQVVGSTENQSSGSFNSANLQGLVNYINDYSPTANNTTGTYVYG